jgi:hypothetical protein
MPGPTPTSRGRCSAKPRAGCSRAVSSDARTRSMLPDGASRCRSKVASTASTGVVSGRSVAARLQAAQRGQREEDAAGRRGRAACVLHAARRAMRSAKRPISRWTKPRRWPSRRPTRARRRMACGRGCPELFRRLARGGCPAGSRRRIRLCLVRNARPVPQGLAAMSRRRRSARARSAPERHRRGLRRQRQDVDAGVAPRAPAARRRASRAKFWPSRTRARRRARSKKGCSTGWLTSRWAMMTRLSASSQSAVWTRGVIRRWSIGRADFSNRWPARDPGSR